jgi:hypothetical protein
MLGVVESLPPYVLGPNLGHDPNMGVGMRQPGPLGIVGKDDC